jgi:hypothetical protein
VVSSGSCVAETPLVAKEPATFYYLTLEAISVGIRDLCTRARLLKRVTLLSTRGH